MKKSKGRTRMSRAAGWMCVFLWGVMLGIGSAAAQQPTIVSISVCGESGVSSMSCPGGSYDTAKPVLAPDGSGNPINMYGGLTTLADEHVTVMPPGTLNGNQDYLFFVASKTNLNGISSGLVVLTGGLGPRPDGQWTFDFAPNFGFYSAGGAAGSTNGQIFLSPTEHDQCPVPLSGTVNQDPTFDLNYADPGTVLVDPTSSTPGSLLMIYEGTNRCLGAQEGAIAGGSASFYSSLAVATSTDYGLTWPTYSGHPATATTPIFNPVPLPGQNRSQGPSAPEGAVGPGQACDGGNCAQAVGADYGRYAVVAPATGISSIMTELGGIPLANNIGNSQPAAFLDDVSGSPAPYLYVVHQYNPGNFDPSGSPYWNGSGSDLVLARGQLNGGSGMLTFSKWYGGAFGESGLGGYQSPIFAAGSPSYCLGNGQLREMGSISYVETAQQYLLVFVCHSNSDPATGSPGPGTAWFYSTNGDLSSADQWSKPQEIEGSWSPLVANGNGCADFAAYPTLMSMWTRPGHLTNRGFVFYTQGCPGDEGTGGGTPPPARVYGTREFQMTLLLTSGQVSMVNSPLAYSRWDQTYYGILMIKNVSGGRLEGPLEVTLTGLPAGVTLVNAQGSYDGSPYLTTAPLGLQAGGTAAVLVAFKDPGNAKIAYTPVVYSGRL
jgi:hypothetical protein